MRIRPILEARDAWVGLYYDDTNSRLYILPVPAIGVSIEPVSKRAYVGIVASVIVVVLLFAAGCSGACYTQDETGALIGCAEEGR